MIDIKTVKILLQIKNDEMDEYIAVMLPSVLNFIKDYLHLDDIEDIPIALYPTIANMIAFNTKEIGIKRRKIKDVDIEYNTGDYPKSIYNTLQKYKRLRLL